MKNSFVLVLIAFTLIATTTAQPDELCVKHMKESYMQTVYSQEYPKVAVPDTKIEFYNSPYAMILTGYKLTYDDFFGKEVLYLEVTYCNKLTNKIEFETKLYPGSNFYRLNYPSISYYGPLSAPDNIACLNVGVKKEKFSALNSLLFSGTRGTPETLLFKRVLSRTAQATKIASSKSVKPRTTSAVGRNNPRQLDDPVVDPNEQKSCYAKVWASAD